MNNSLEKWVLSKSIKKERLKLDNMIKNKDNYNAENIINKSNEINVLINKYHQIENKINQNK